MIIPHKPNNVVFRCDATPSIGIGHLMRCKVLAEHFVERGWLCQFLCSEETFNTCAYLFDNRFTYSYDQGDIPVCELLVVDHYGLNQVYEKKCRAKAQSIFIIDDLADRFHDCDFLLDQTEGRQAIDYSHLVPSQCRLMVGAEFALLRKAFAEIRPLALKRRAEQVGQINNILISFGGTNLHHITEKVTEFFIDYSTQPFHLMVVTGSSNSISGKLYHFADEINNKSIHTIEVLSSVLNIENLMLKADLALGAAGTTSWERCCLGLPTIMIELAENQKYIASQLHERGAALNLGWHEKVGKKEIFDILDMCCHQSQHIIDMQSIAFDICDGQGVERTTRLLEEKL